MKRRTLKQLHAKRESEQHRDVYENTFRVFVPRQSGSFQTTGRTMNTHSFFSRLGHSPITRRAAVMLVALAWSSLAFCGEIHDAAKAGDVEKVKALLKSNPDLVFSKDDKNGATPLHLAVDNGRKDVAELLLANKADVNAKEDGGGTPLHGAAIEGSKDVAALLLANKAEVNAKNEDGKTPFHVAAFYGYDDMLALLRQHGGHE